jgi:hypothetical protein
MRRIIFLLLILALSSNIIAKSAFNKGNAAGRPRLAISPTLEFGGIDNGPAFVNLVPFQMEWQVIPEIAMKWSAGYVFEQERHNKPFGTLNHYGYRFSGRLEWSPFNWAARFFYGINIGAKAPGAKTNLDMLGVLNYQSFGITFPVVKEFVF